MAVRVLVVVVLAGVALAGCGIGSDAVVGAGARHPSFEATVLEGTIVTPVPTRMYVGYAVSNVGKARGAAACRVLVGGQVRGSITTHELAAGATWYQLEAVRIPAQLGDQMIRSESINHTAGVGSAVSVVCTDPRRGSD